MFVNSKHIKQVYNKLKHLPDPFAVCVLCHCPLNHRAGLCDACMALLKPLPEQLCRCSLPSLAAPNGELCGRCIKRPPYYTTTFCGWQYGFPLDRLLNRYKHQGELAIEPLLASIWLARLQGQAPAEGAIFVPIPIHWRRYWKRGFNQTARLARLLSQHTDRPVWEALAQPHKTPMLQGLKASARRRQIRNRFSVTGKVAGQHLILVDDVMTTGSTANEAARLLIKQGAARVDLWALCRVLVDHRHDTSP